METERAVRAFVQAFFFQMEKEEIRGLRRLHVPQKIQSASLKSQPPSTERIESLVNPLPAEYQSTAASRDLKKTI